MWIKTLNAAPALYSAESDATLTLTRSDVHIINSALYRYIADGKNKDMDIRKLYSDLMIVEQLMEADVLMIGQLKELRNIEILRKKRKINYGILWIYYSSEECT